MSILESAINTAQNSLIAFSKFITPNDTGSTSAHQSGYHIHKEAWSVAFDKPGVKGETKDCFVTIKWQDDFTTTSRFIFYGEKTRNEYRLTRFGRGFPYLRPENVGDLLVLCKIADKYYHAYVLSSDDEIEEFFAALNISSDDTNGLIPRQFVVSAESQLIGCFKTYLQQLLVDFPPTIELATSARNCYNGAHGIRQTHVLKDPDGELLNWLDAEFQLFKLIEADRYSTRIKAPFANIEELVETANTILNRRKSRAGKSLEHHLGEVFRTFNLDFATQAFTEDKKKPDFIFPSASAYRNKMFSNDKLVMLACKTTCKDRWRQVLNEADRIKTKHLFTLQQGISKNQLDEMYKYNVCLVVPEPYLKSFPKEYRHRILTLSSFSKHVASLR